MSGNQTSSTNQTQTQVANPVAQSAIAPIASMGVGIANTPYNTGMNVNVAGQNAQQLAAIQGLGGLQTNNPASGYINQANQYSQLAADPNNVVRMAQQFYNPMSQQVMAQLGNVFGQQNAQMLGNAAASGAIGGSRYGVAAGNLANQQGLAAGQTLAGLQQQALNAAQTEQGQISQQAFTQGNLGQEALGTQLTGINAALQGGNLTQQQQQALLNAATQNAIQQTLFPQQEAAAGMNIAQGAIPLGGTTYGQGKTSQPVNYAGQILGGGLAGVGLMGGVPGISNLFGSGSSTPQFGAYGGAMRKREDGGATTDSGSLENYFEHQPQVNVAQAHYPTLNMGQQGGQGTAGQSSSAGGGGLGGLGGLGSLASLGSSAMGGLSGIGSAIGSGIGELGGALGGALSSAGEFLPMLALLKDGGVVKRNVAPRREGTVQHRAIGGGTGVGNGTSGLLGYSGLSGGLEPYFAQTPKVNVSQANFPTLSLSQQGPNTAQQQVDQQTQQISQLAKLGQDIGKQYPISSGIQSDADFAHGGRIHMQDGGDPSSIQAANDAFFANNQGFGLGASIIPSASAAVTPTNAGPSTIERFLNERRNAALHPSPLDYGAQPPPPVNDTLRQYLAGRPAQTEATQMAAQSRIPGSGQYVSLNYDGRPIGAPQAAASDPALIQRAPIQQAAIASPAQTPPPVASPQQPTNPYFEAGHPYYSRLRPAESGADPYAQAATSSAFGPYQFTKATWHNDVVVRHPELGLTDEDRLNPAAQERAIVPFTKDKQSALIRAGIDPTSANTYMAHFLGDAGAAQFLGALKANPKTPADSVVNPQSVAANHNVFYNPDGSPKTVGEVYAGLNARISGNPAQPSGLQDPSLQPPKPGDSYLDRTLAAFGIHLNQPQGLGGLAGRALGIPQQMDQQTSNRLVNMGLGMMAAGPTVGVKGFPGAAINTLTAAGKGGEFALGQEQQERAQAINLANAAMNQRLHEAQIQHYNYETKKPFVYRSSVETVTDPLTGMVVGTRNINHYATMDESGHIRPVDEQMNAQLNGVSQGTTQPAQPAIEGAPTPQQLHMSAKTLAEAQAQGLTGEDLLGYIKDRSPADEAYVRQILAGQRKMPEITKNNPRAAIIRDMAALADPGYDEARIKYRQEWMRSGSNTGKQRIANNAAISHMGSAADLLEQAKGVPDHDWGPLTSARNQFSLWWQGKEAQPWVSRWKANAKVLADEVAKVAAATGQSALADRQENENNLDLSKGRTAILNTLDQYQQLLAGKSIHGLQADWELNMGPYAPAPEILSPYSKNTLQKVQAYLDRHNAQEPTTAQTAAPSSVADQAETLRKRLQPTTATPATTPTSIHDQILTNDKGQKIHFNRQTNQWEPYNG